MVNSLTSCCCGCSLKTGVKTLAIIDILLGVSTIISLTSISQVETHQHSTWTYMGVEYSSDTPLDLPKLDHVINVLNSIGNVTVLLFFVSAIVALRGVSKGKSRLVRQYAMIRAMEVALSIALSIWLLVIIPRLAREFIDAVLEQMREEAKKHHEDPPEVDEEALIKIVTFVLSTVFIIMEIFGVLLKLYFVWVVKSCADWMERGVDPYAPIYLVTEPSTNRNAYQPANVILGPPVAAPASDQPTASLLVSEGPQNPSAPVLLGENQPGSVAGTHNQAVSGDAYPRI
ncbi:hypothetical protein Pmar_PMAR024150 [Perkinsus marinus ATCC 50983]|uniref:Uncharacterized protein n=1 Tax=Perkinsus marinus (strain ATCC 50983 / TXsc) TaxID=423536 RepID=C5L2B4_PERM5|nr:hypothetical protein Pmar_PMAR024150 [Perkinsus marinus ATCC 50983]EER09126.1 hypothetical protein Pmar_PMAR024150 [Perkinsus marinus ATCC 50983]|eukprot:XP_002777310.1 hypothetical protein Pmar_PMAR024150 [Perkinsus marinus ATCC 50983]